MIIGLVTIFALGFVHAGDLAGGDMSGGGGAFVCYNADGSIKDAETLDLWEGSNLPGFRDLVDIEYSGRNPDSQAYGALEKLKPSDDRFFTDVKEELLQLMNPKNHVFLGDSVEIDPPTDTEHSYSKPGCPLRGLAYYDSMNRKLAIKKSYYDALTSDTDRAAIWLHEAVYKVMRDKDKQATSTVSRRLVACLLSKKPCWDTANAYLNLPTDRDIYSCFAPFSTSFYAYKMKGNNWHLIFNRLGAYQSGDNRIPKSNEFESGLEMDVLTGAGYKNTTAFSDVYKFLSEDYFPSKYFMYNVGFNGAPDTGIVDFHNAAGEAETVKCTLKSLAQLPVSH